MTQGQLVTVGLCLLAYVVAIVIIWREPEVAIAAVREADFAAWRARIGRFDATFAEFLASEEAPRHYLSRWGKTGLATSLVAFALVVAARDWGYL